MRHHVIVKLETAQNFMDGKTGIDWLLLLRRFKKSANQDTFDADIGCPFAVLDFLYFSVLKTRGFLPKEMLYYFMFIDLYNSTRSLHATFGISRRTYRRRVYGINKVLKGLGYIYMDLLYLDDWSPCKGRNACGSVDTTECLIENPLDNDDRRFFYSGKQKKCTVKYQTVVTMNKKLICGLTGPLRGPFPDGDMVRMSQFLEYSEAQDRNMSFFADLHYTEFFPRVFTKKSPGFTRGSAERRLLGRKRATVETTNAFLKRFKLLRHAFRHGRGMSADGLLDRHAGFTQAIANICNLTIILHTHKEDVASRLRLAKGSKMQRRRRR